MELRPLLRLSLSHRPFPHRLSPLPIPRPSPLPLRRLSTTPPHLAPSPPTTPHWQSLSDQIHTNLGSLGTEIAGVQQRSPPSPSSPSSLRPPNPTSTVNELSKYRPPPSGPGVPPSEREHHLHIYAHKHNTMLTLTSTSRQPLLVLSCGNLGFRKAQRKSYDAAFQLAAYFLTRVQQQGLLPEIQALELVFRGFGIGREAVMKVIMGPEGVGIRGKVCRVVDATRLKIGGPRGKRARRLG